MHVTNGESYPYRFRKRRQITLLAGCAQIHTTRAGLHSEDEIGYPALFSDPILFISSSSYMNHAPEELRMRHIHTFIHLTDAMQSDIDSHGYWRSDEASSLGGITAEGNPPYANKRRRVAQSTAGPITNEIPRPANPLLTTNGEDLSFRAIPRGKQPIRGAVSHHED